MPNGNADINYDVVLSKCNARLTKWDEDWRIELERGEPSEFVLFLSISTRYFSQRGKISFFIPYFLPVVRQTISEQFWNSSLHDTGKSFKSVTTYNMQRYLASLREAINLLACKPSRHVVQVLSTLCVSFHKSFPKCMSWQVKSLYNTLLVYY